MNKKGIILLSSGLDSLVSLYLAKHKCDIVLALTFDYGQRAVKEEIEASRKIAEQNGIEHKVIELPFLKEACNCALVDNSKNIDFDKLDEKSAMAVWVPNRNGLFLNIAAMYADSMGADYIIYGANKEEAATFSDNSKAFNQRADEFFKYSTQKHPIILAPCSDMEKFEIINCGLEEGADFSLLKSCYNSKTSANKAHCGKCESCRRLHDAILKSNKKDLINLIF